MDEQCAGKEHVYAHAQSGYVQHPFGVNVNESVHALPQQIQLLAETLHDDDEL